MRIHNKVFLKRLLISSFLGILAGMLCFMGFSSKPDMPAEMAKLQIWSWNNFMMWSTIANRFAIGVMVGLGGYLTQSLVLGIKIHPWIRGAKIGFIISLSMALGALINPDPTVAKTGFWLVLILGIIIGMLIDIITTKLTGEGSDLK